VFSCEDRGGCVFFYSGNDVYLVEKYYNFHYKVDYVATDEIGVCYGSDFAVFLDGTPGVSYQLDSSYLSPKVLKSVCFESKHPTYYFRTKVNPYSVVDWIVALDESFKIPVSPPSVYLSDVQSVESIPVDDDVACGNDVIELGKCVSSSFLCGERFFSESDRLAVFTNFARKNGVRKSHHDYLTSINHVSKATEYSVSTNVVNLKQFGTWNSRAKKNKHRVLLDYGCGDTRYGKSIAKLLAVEYFGFDVGVHRGHKDDSVTLDHMRVKSKTIDCVVLSHVLHHVCSPTKILSQAARVLIEKGLLIVKEHDVSSPQ